MINAQPFFLCWFELNLYGLQRMVGRQRRRGNLLTSRATHLARFITIPSQPFGIFHVLINLYQTCRLSLSLSLTYSLSLSFSHSLSPSLSLPPASHPLLLLHPSKLFHQKTYNDQYKNAFPSNFVFSLLRKLVFQSRQLVFLASPLPTRVVVVEVVVVVVVVVSLQFQLIDALYF